MEQKYRVLVTSRSFADRTGEAMKLLENESCRVVVRRGPLGQAEMKEALADVDAVIIGSDKIDGSAIRHASKLKVISTHGVGIDGIDIPAANERNIVVANVPGTMNEAVADLAVGLMVSLARSIITAHNKTVQGTWEMFLGRSVYGKCLGILGLGAIGREVVKRASGFHMDVRAFDVVQDSDFAEEWGVEYASMNQVLQAADYLSIHLPLNDKTRGILDLGKLRKMKKTAYLINLSRGGVLNEQDLVYALNQGIIAGAALDVFEKEPPDRMNPLFRCENLIATPHMGARVEEAVAQTSIQAATNIVCGLRGEWDRIPIVNTPVGRSG